MPRSGKTDFGDCRSHGLHCVWKMKMYDIGLKHCVEREGDFVYSGTGYKKLINYYK